jgi:prepilin peptidase CpaA
MGKMFTGLSPEAWIAGVLGSAAIIEDLARRRISNWVPLCALIGGVVCQVLRRGWMGVPLACAGALVGFLVFLIFYLLGGMGGGDIKLMAGFGAVLGYSRLLEAALWAAGIGGILAMGVIGFRALRRLWSSGVQPPEESAFIPYAPAIALGVWLSLIPK